MIIYLLLIALTSVTCIQELYKDYGDVNIAFILNVCKNKTDITPYSTQTLINSAIWTIERLNFLEVTFPLTLGLSVYKTCNEYENLNTIFHLYDQSEEENYQLGVISEEKFPEKVARFSAVLGLRTSVLRRSYKHLVKASVRFLSALSWVENVTVIVSDERVLNEFYAFSRRKFICISECYFFTKNTVLNFNGTGPVVFFGTKTEITEFSKAIEDDVDYMNILFVPLDKSVPIGLPENTYVILPQHAPLSQIFTKSVNIIPTPLLFEIANPLINYAQSISDFIKENCNETIYKVNCIRSTFYKNVTEQYLSLSEITEILKIKPLQNSFDYNIYKVENITNNTSESVRNNFFMPFLKVFGYNVFTDKLISYEDNTTQKNVTLPEEFCKQHPEYCLQNCKNYMYDFFATHHSFTKDFLNNIVVRSDAWVYAFLSLSLLGVLFCIIILVFILLSICRRDILEGNPALTIILLISVMLMFLAVLPFCLDVSPNSKETICLIKTLAITLTYAMAFSLLLSRCILLASAAKEIGFMSHIAGTVQSFLSLFIFGVQAALSLQFVGKCAEILKGHSLIFLLSYNAMLLLLLLCLCPLIYKCQRNYREGKYFTIGICLTVISWSVWLPGYSLLNRQWKEPILCFGILSTASILLGCIFIPRTYLMTIAAARDKITSRIPSLTTAASAIDIYRANTQPVYDCVNIAAINAVNVARAGVAGQTLQEPDLYSCPALPDDDDCDYRCDTPLSSDKVTRF